MLVINPTASVAIKSRLSLIKFAASKNLSAITSPVAPTATCPNTVLGVL